MGHKKCFVGYLFRCSLVVDLGLKYLIPFVLFTPFDLLTSLSVEGRKRITERRKEGRKEGKRRGYLLTLNFISGITTILLAGNSF